MTSIDTVGSVIIKLLKLVINIIIIILYRTGFNGGFLGVGGTWNLNEEKNPDSEIVASGIFVGYMIYNIVSILNFCFSSNDHKNSFTDVMMNVIGVFMWIAVGATALHYWNGYLQEHKYTHVDSERSVGLAMGSLCVLNGAAYLIDSVLSGLFLARAKLK